MADTNRPIRSDHEETSQPGAGTMIGLGYVGAVILITYLVLYALYLARA